MDQKQTEQNFSPNKISEGELKRTETSATPELESAKEAQPSSPETAGAVQGEREASKPTLPWPKTKKRTAIPPPRDQVTIKVEKILSEGLDDTYAGLSPIAQQEFKLKGEQTAVSIREILRSTKVKAKKIFQLILEWLSLLPNVNKFFLEQEAKIKTDRIIELNKREQENIHF
ncbi:MAG: hypothetical protein WC457_03470 [Patescibacteria group bacterium]